MDITKLQVVRVLSRDSRRHGLNLACSVPGSDKLALVQVTATVPAEDSLSHILSVEQLNETNYRLLLSEGRLTVTVMHPGAKQFYLKHLESPYLYFEETALLYEAITKPYIESIKPATLQWVYNLLDHVSEAEDIFVEDPDPRFGVTLVPDLKVKNIAAEAFYFSVVFRRRDIKSLRDLRAEHIPMLKRVNELVTQSISSKLCVDPRSVQLFFHYLPSFYHLHLHATNMSLSNELPRARLLSQVIRNLEHDSDYYAKATITIALNSNHPMFSAYANHYGIEIPPQPDLQADLDRLD